MRKHHTITKKEFIDQDYEVEVCIASTMNPDKKLFVTVKPQETEPNCMYSVVWEEDWKDGSPIQQSFFEKFDAALEFYNELY